MLREVGNHGFFAIAPRAIKQNRNLNQISSDNKDMLFHCPEQGCCSEFTFSEELQDHVHLGKHYWYYRTIGGKRVGFPFFILRSNDDIIFPQAQWKVRVNETDSVFVT